MFVCAFAEYVSHGMFDISSRLFSVVIHRLRYGVLLWDYARRKQNDGAISESEATENVTSKHSGFKRSKEQSKRHLSTRGHEDVSEDLSLWGCPSKEQALKCIMANEGEMPSWFKSIVAKLDVLDSHLGSFEGKMERMKGRMERMKRIMDRMDGRIERTESSICKKLDNLIEHPKFPNPIPMSGQAPHELLGNQTNSCTLVNKANNQLSVNDSLSLSETNVPSFCDDNVQLEIVDTLVDPPSVEAIVASDSILSYGSHEDQFVCENSDVEHVGRLTKDGPSSYFCYRSCKYRGNI
ncbi:hypothetical protein FXO38_01416 [Capsicum annuum]|nr:hypothetical protein FXO38_01416 [Capsicum annuum]